MKRYGHMRVRELLSQEVFPAAMRHAPLAWQFASLGKVSAAWLDEMRDSFSAGRCRTAGASASPVLPHPSPESRFGCEMSHTYSLCGLRP